MKYDLCCVSIEIFSFLQKRDTVSYAEGMNSSLGLSLPVDCTGSSDSSCRWVLWKQLRPLLPFGWQGWFSSTRSVGAVTLGRDVGFLPLQGQGLSPTSRELVGLVYVCGTVGPDICLFYGWCNDGWSLPPPAALCMLQSLWSFQEGKYLDSCPWPLKVHIH